MDAKSGQLVGRQIQKFSARGCALLFALVCAGWSTASWGQEMTADKLLQANRKTWAAIRSIEMKVDTRITWVNDGVAQPTSGHVAHSFWAKGDGFERYSTDVAGSQEVEDHLIQQGEESVLVQSKDRVSRATKGPAQSSTLRVPTPLVLRELPGIFTERGDSLESICSKWKLEVRGPVPAGKEQLWKVKATNPNPKRDERGTVLEIEITFNASRGFLIQKVDGTQLQLRVGATSDKGPFTPCRCVCEVTRFRNFGPGIDFPEQSVYQLLPTIAVAPNAPRNEFSIQFTATKLDVNQPLSDTAKNFRFPENSVVTINGPKGTRPKYAVWGPKNVPVRELANEFELKRYEAEREGRNYAAQVTMEFVSLLFVNSYGWMIEFADRVLPPGSLS